jgi:site-specific DNA-methyltransferase (adenine-specific)
MDAVGDGSVALVVTSPPYFAGKQYEEELERGGVPSSYLEYLDLLRDVFAECVRTLEPGGRIAVNVANLGRKPYRSLSADVVRILEDELGLLLRGELIWQKAEGASGSCAWGSYRSAANPVLRDITERVIVASKGRFDRARTVRQRAAEGLPHRNTINTDDFMALTLDVWSIAPESARRVGHPAPFPVELPEQLIRLYTYEDDLVLDPFMGAGSALVAAARLGRRYIGYDTDPAYVEIARQRLAGAEARPDPTIGDGRAAAPTAEDALGAAGFRIVARKHKVPRTGVEVSFAAEDRAGARWLFDVVGPLASYRGGMQRSSAVWEALGRASAIRGRGGDDPAPLVLVTSHLPKMPSAGRKALHAAGPSAFFDAVELFSAAGAERLSQYAGGGHTDKPLPGFWTEADLARRR